ncbi:MAG: polysaccharide biosynthesis C-terminal domain-containing protein, partial [Pseudomonadota bacterium]
NGEISARDALVSVLFAVAVAVAIQTGFFLYRRSAALMPGAGQPAGPVGRELAGVAFPMFIASILGTLMTHADVLMLGILAGREETAALYAASRLSMLVALPLVIVNGGLATIFTRHFARNDSVALQKAVTFGAHASLWPTLGLSVFAVVFAEELLRLFGDFYEEQKMLLFTLILGQLINVAAGSVAVLLTVTKHEKKNARVLAVTVVVNIGMNLILIPRFGALGAAAATATSLVVRNLWLYGVVRRELGIYPSVFKAL